MNASSQHGYLVLADVSGYTAFISETELTHSHEIMGELLELIIQRLQPILTLATIEGDAVFTYSADSKVTRGETLLELIETTYTAFKDRIETIRQHTTCTCNACKSVLNLDLNFMAHYGEYLLRHNGNTPEPIGVEASLIRKRVLKDHLSAQHGFALFTQAALDQMKIHPDDWIPCSTSYESLGEIKFYRTDLQACYRQMIETRRVYVQPHQADLIMSYDIAAPPPVVWEWLNDPSRRTQWMVGRKWNADLRLRGRTAVGARNHCDHGGGQVVEIIVDWRPFDYFTVEVSIDPTQKLTQTYRLESHDDRLTHLSTQIKFEALPSPQWFLRPVAKAMIWLLLRSDYQRLAKMIEENK